MPVSEEVLEELYSAPLEEFVARRTTLAKELRAEGRRDDAADVAALRKPALPVWAVNQLARRNRPAVEALLRAGDALRAAMGEGDRDAFAAAQREHGEALRRLRGAAERLLGDTTGSTLDRVVATFRSASVDKELRDLLAAGRLGEEPEAGGFDALAGITLAPPRREPRESARDTVSPARQRRERQERLKRAQDALRDAKARHRELAKAAETAEREAERARDAADEAAGAVQAAEAEVSAAKQART